jgi:hypothetical protein
MNRGASVILASFLFLAAHNSARAGVGDDLAKTAQKAATAESYSFTIVDKSGKGVEGAYQKDQPIFYRADKIEFYKKGDTLAYKQGEDWKKSKKGIESDPLAILAVSARVNAARLPHEELAILAKSLKDAKKEEKAKDGLEAYVANVTEDGAKKLAPTESQSVARGAVATLWVDKDGAVVKYTLTIRLQGRLGNLEVDGTTEKTVTLSEMGKAKIELPAGAKKALE